LLRFGDFLVPDADALRLREAALRIVLLRIFRNNIYALSTSSIGLSDRSYLTPVKGLYNSGIWLCDSLNAACKCSLYVGSRNARNDLGLDEFLN
jgi:hypothetical protein